MAAVAAAGIAAAEAGHDMAAAEMGPAEAAAKMSGGKIVLVLEPLMAAEEPAAAAKAEADERRDVM